jgi:hypothetical protein
MMLVLVLLLLHAAALVLAGQGSGTSRDRADSFLSAIAGSYTHRLSDQDVTMTIDYELGSSPSSIVRR